MTENDLERLKKKLIQQRQEIFQGHKDLEEGWQDLSERDIEFGEEAQKTQLTELFKQLDKREKQEIEEIDTALTKIAAAAYGSCEICKKQIPLERFESLPSARYCLKCAAREEEKTRIPSTSI